MSANVPELRNVQDAIESVARHLVEGASFFEAVVEVGSELFVSDAALFLVPGGHGTHPDADYLEVRAAWGEDDPAIWDVVLPLQSSVSGQSFLNGKIRVIRDVMTEDVGPAATTRAYSEQFGYRAGLTAEVGEKGVLALLSKQIGAFDEKAAEPMTAFTRCAAAVASAYDAGRIKSTRRLTLELHDGPLQMLSGLLLDSEIDSEQGVPLGDSRSSLVAGVRQTIAELRAIVAESVIDETALFERLEAIPSALNAPGIEIVTIGTDLPGEHPATPEVTRIAIEGASNAIRHSGGSAARIVATVDEATICIEIADVGTGFDLEEPRRGGFGLKSIAERTERIGGRLDIRSQPDVGTTIYVEIPRIGRLA